MQDADPGVLCGFDAHVHGSSESDVLWCADVFHPWSLGEALGNVLIGRAVVYNAHLVLGRFRGAVDAPNQIDHLVRLSVKGYDDVYGNMGYGISHKRGCDM